MPHTRSLTTYLLTNSKDTKIVSGTILDDLSYHFMMFIVPNLSKKKSKPKVIKCRHYTKAKMDSFKCDLQNTNWQSVTSTTNVNSCYDQFWKIYSDHSWA